MNLRHLFADLFLRWHPDANPDRGDQTVRKVSERQDELERRAEILQTRARIIRREGERSGGDYR